MSETYQRLFTKILFFLNMAMASLALFSFTLGWLSTNNIFVPSMVSTVAYAGLVIYWRFWYIFALPAFYLGQNTNASRRQLLLTALSAFMILLIKLLYGYQLPD